nr:immunoglobulin light chain junction region [Macaca mulatta]MOX81175.1 immunoglobulin light chain junction region [Macaca mulatta]MOX81260.1 immunoglobulin light chain junction region [Macaca mulatta]MOX81994.1 immunoglobulin light chain junction region [Macaca mulatta]MOX82281.1 immunoglobulin light chain junction region [Macaca mulatta]
DYYCQSYDVTLDAYIF